MNLPQFPGDILVPVCFLYLLAFQIASLLPLFFLPLFSFSLNGGKEYAGTGKRKSWFYMTFETFIEYNTAFISLKKYIFAIKILKYGLGLSE